MKYVTADGAFTVEPIELRNTTRQLGDGAWLKVTRNGPFPSHAGDVRTPAELARFGIDLADLVRITA